MSTKKKIIRFLLKYKNYLLLLLISIPIISKLDVWSQTLLGTIVDKITSADKWVLLISIYVIALIILFVAKQGFGMVEQRMTFKVTYDLRAAIAEKILHIKSESLDGYTSDELMQMWNEDVREIQSVSVKSIFNFAIWGCSAVLALLELWRISYYFPLVALLVNLIAIIPVKILGRQNKKRSQNRRASKVAMNEKFYALFNNIRLIKTYGKEQEELSKFEELNDKFVDDKLSFSVSSRVYKSVMTSVKAIAPTIILLIANFEIRDGRMTIGDVVLATSLLETVSKPFSEGGNFVINLKAIGFKFNHIFHFLEMENEQLAGICLEQSAPFAIQFNNVSYRVKENDILKNINFSVKAGEKVAIVGESGSGKTTLNNLLLRLYQPTEGNLLLNGHDVREFNLQSYRREIHYSQSTPYMANASIMENLMILGATEDTCVQMAKAIDFHDEITTMADGYNTVIDAGSSNISGGQKKKIAIIRALAQKSCLYVFDEITRGIDDKAAVLIMNYLLKHITATAIFTMHNLGAVECMDKIVVMQSGRIIAQGKHEELYDSCDYYRALYDNRRRAGND